MAHVPHMAHMWKSVENLQEPVPTQSIRVASSLTCLDVTFLES